MALLASISPAARRRAHDEAGAIAILVAFGALILFVIAGLIVDLGLARDTRRSSQNTVDSAALAAANSLYPVSATCLALNPTGTLTSPCVTDAINTAKDYAADNFGITAADWASCTDGSAYWYPAGGTPCISFTDNLLGSSQPTTPTKIRVRTPTKNVSTTFGTLAGKNSVTVASAARVTIGAGTQNNCAICFLGSIDAGNADVTVSGGGIQVSGDLDVGANGYWTATSIGASGSVSGSHFTPAVTTTPTFTDPLASLAMPTYGTAVDRTGTTTCNGTIQPGKYKSLSLGNKDTCTLSPGLYVITGKWLLGNKSVLQGSGVTLYFTCGTAPSSIHTCTGADTSGGWLDAKNGELAISSGATGYAGYAIIYDRQNPEDIGLQGNGGTAITGAVYAASASLDFNGNSCFGFSGGPVVVEGVIKANGNKSCINVTNATNLTASTSPGSFSLDQ